MTYLRNAFPDVKLIFSDMRELARGKGREALSGKTMDVPKVGPSAISEILQSPTVLGVTSNHDDFYKCEH